MERKKTPQKNIDTYLSHFDDLTLKPETLNTCTIIQVLMEHLQRF